MYHCTYKIVVSGLSQEIKEYIVNTSEELFGNHFEVTVTESDRINGKIISEADAIIVRSDKDKDIANLVEMYAVNRKTDANMIVLTNGNNAENVLERGNEISSLLTDIWPYDIDGKLFAYKYGKWVESIKLQKEKWLLGVYLDNVIDSSDDLIWFKDKEGVHVRVNQSFCDAVHKTKEQVSGRGHYYIWDITPEDYVAGEYVCMESEYEVMGKKQKCWFDEEVLINDSLRQLRTCKTPLFDCDGSVMGTVGVAKDVTNELKYKAMLEADLEKMHKSSRTDVMTGVYNRRALDEDIKRLVADNELSNTIYISFDINGLKKVNDTIGFAAGDELINAAAKCISTCFRDYGRTYRIGGDEFVAIIKADDHDIVRLFRDFDNMVYDWTGEYSKQLRISYGYAPIADGGEADIQRAIREATEKLGEVKAAYYARKGIDKKGSTELLNILTQSYSKVFKLNLSSDVCIVIRSDDDALSAAMGFDERLSEAVKIMCSSDNIHEDDNDNFAKQMDIISLRMRFKSGEKHISFSYRRKTAEGYRLFILEMVPAAEYTQDNQIVYMYEKCIG